jgi:hypothetical protein
MFRIIGAVFVVIVAVAVATASSHAREHRTSHASKYCLSEWFAGEDVNCSFRTMTQCEQSKTSLADMCRPNPRARSTTGSATRE